MFIQVDQLQSLVTEKSPASRQIISDITWTNFQMLTNDNLSALDGILRNELLVLTTEAQKICDDFYIWQKEINSTLPKEDQTHLFARVLLRDNSLTIDWIYQRTYKDKVTHKRFTHSKRIVPAHKYRLSANQWKKQPLWLQERMASVEKDLAFIRERIDFLGQIRQSVRNYKDVVIRTRNAKKKDLDLEALPVPLISAKRSNKSL